MYVSRLHRLIMDQTVKGTHGPIKADDPSTHVDSLANQVTSDWWYRGHCSGWNSEDSNQGSTYSKHPWSCRYNCVKKNDGCQDSMLVEWMPTNILNIRTLSCLEGDEHSQRISVGQHSCHNANIWAQFWWSFVRTGDISLANGPERDNHFVPVRIVV